MSATIKTTLVDNSKEWSDQLRKRFLEAGGSADDFEDHIAALNRELESRAAKRAADDIKALADEIDGSAAAANRHRDALAGNGLKWTEFASKANLAGSAIKGVWQGAKEAGEMIHFFAEKGVPGFEKLEQAGTRAMDSLVAAASNPGIEKGMQVATAAVDSLLVPAIKNAGEIVGNLGEIAHTATSGLMSLAGVDFSKQARELEKMDAELRKIAAEVKTERTIEARRREAVEMDEINSAQLAREQRQKEIAEIDNEHRAARELAKATKQYADSRKAMQTTDDNTYRHHKRLAEQAWQDMRQLDAKERELIGKRQEEQMAKAKESHDQMVKFHEDEFNKFLELENLKAEKQRERHQAEQAALQLWQNAQQKQVDQLAQFFGGGQQGGQGGQGPNVIGQIKGGISDKARFDQVVKQRQHDALQSWRDKQALGKRNFAGELVDPDADPNDPATFLGRKDGTGGPAAYQKKLQREREQIERQTRMRAHRDMRRGRLSNEEVATAEGALVNSTADLLEQGGAINTNAATAIKQLANQAARQAQETAAANDMLRNVLTQLNALQGRGANSTQRAQRQ